MTFLFFPPLKISTLLLALPVLVAALSSCSVLNEATEEITGKSPGKTLGKAVKKILNIDGKEKECSILRREFKVKKRCWLIGTCEERKVRCVNECTGHFVTCPAVMERGEW